MQAYDDDRGRASRERRDPRIRCSYSLTASSEKTGFFVRD